MGVVVNPLKAFRVCHGYKIDNELILWSEGVIGTLSDGQEYKCQKIIIENAKEPNVYNSVGAALKATTLNLPHKEMGQVIAVRRCAKLLHEADQEGLINGVGDTYSFLDYCMAKQGYVGKKQWQVREKIKDFIDRHI